ncbi:MAG: M48 family metallopeptidase [Chitinophagales bacterium]
MYRQFTGYYSDVIIPVGTLANVTLLSDRLLIELPSRNEKREWFYGLIRRKYQRKKEVAMTYKDPLKGQLVVEDLGFLLEVQRAAPYATFTHAPAWYQTKNGLYGMFAVKIGSIVLAILLFLFALPYLVDFSVNRMSQQTENSIGKKIKNSLVNPLEIDTTQTRLVNEFFNQFSKPGDDSIHITVVNSSVKNAFTLPGGEILIYNGIFSAMNNYPELAGVLGHESGHAENRDPLKMLARESATSVLLLTLIGNMNAVINEILSNASYISNLSYSRSYESRADHFSYDWMKKNGVNPQGMIDLLNNLDSADHSVNVEFISDHPTTQNRIKDLQSWMKKDSTKHYDVNPKLDSIWVQIKLSVAKQDSIIH